MILVSWPRCPQILGWKPGVAEEPRLVVNRGASCCDSSSSVRGGGQSDSGVELGCGGTVPGVISVLRDPQPESGDGRSGDVVLLFRSQYWSMVRLAALLVDDPDSAEDVVQEAYLSLHRRQRSLRDPDKAVDYLRSAVLNLARSRRATTQWSGTP